MYIEDEDRPKKTSSRELPFGPKRRSESKPKECETPNKIYHASPLFPTTLFGDSKFKGGKISGGGNYPFLKENVRCAHLTNS